MAGASLNEHALRILDEVQARAPRAIADVGMGGGAYGRYLRTDGYRGLLLGVEVWAPYVDGLDCIAAPNLGCYDAVIIRDIRDVLRTRTLHDQVDLVLAIDVIEHFERLEAAVVLEQLRELAPVLVTTPTVPWPQGPIAGNPYETHRSSFDVRALEQLGGRLLERGRFTSLFEFSRSGT